MAIPRGPEPTSPADASQNSGLLRPVRIAFCVTHLGLGGAEKTLCNLVLGLDRRRWQPAVFHLSEPDDLADTLRGAGVPVSRIGARHRWDVSAVLRLARALRRFRPRLLQTFLFHANLAGRIAATWAGVPVIVCGARVAERRSRLPLMLDNLTCRLADHTICVSRGVADFTARHAHWPRSRLSVIPNAVDAERVASAQPADRAALGIPPEALVIIFVGRLDEQKAPLDLVEAFAELAPNVPEAHLLLIGHGPLYDPVEHRVAELQLAARVHLSGWRPDVPELLHAADILALPSHWEGMPNVVLEAMAAGLPVVATRVEGTGELVRDGDTGLLVEPGHREAMARALLELSRSSDRRRCMGRAARARVIRHYTVPRMVSDYERCYLRLSGRSARQSGSGHVCSLAPPVC